MGREWAAMGSSGGLIASEVAVPTGRQRPETRSTAGILRAPGAIAQLGERLLCKQEVTGSIPVGST